MSAWNNWFHCCGGTYGSWLRGDPRGWRARHHREHVDGDYKNPPPTGIYDKLFERSKRLMKRQRVVLNPQQREMACRLMAEALLYHHVELIDLCVGGKHSLARYWPINQVKTAKRDPVHLMGIAKKHSARVTSDSGIVERDGVWAVRCKVIPIENEFHFESVVGYIPDHAKRGAAVYSLLMERDSKGRPGI
jgi:hypothetical protein